MKFKVNSKLLSARLTAVSKVVNSKNTITILDNFLFSLEGDILVVTGSDNENTLIARIPVESAEGQGRFAVNVKNMLDAIKSVSDQTLDFNIDDRNFEINIRYQNGFFNFIGINGDEFPRRDEQTGGQIRLTLSAKEVAESLDHTLFAVATEDFRPIMMGVLWDIKDDSIVFVASDTHKLVRFTNNHLMGGEAGDHNFILPAKPASILLSLLPREEGEVVKVEVDEKGAIFTCDEFTLICRLINGRYPNYNSVIPENNPHVVTFDRVSLLNAVKRVSVFASVGGLVKFDLRQNSILLKTQDIDLSTSAEETVSCDYAGAAMVIGFNAERTIEVLNSIDDDNVVLHLGDPSRAGVFFPMEQKEGRELLILLMPMMI